MSGTQPHRPVGRWSSLPAGKRSRRRSYRGFAVSGQVCMPGMREGGLRGSPRRSAKRNLFLARGAAARQADRDMSPELKENHDHAGYRDPRLHSGHLGP